MTAAMVKASGAKNRTFFERLSARLSPCVSDPYAGISTHTNSRERSAYALASPFRGAGRGGSGVVRREVGADGRAFGVVVVEADRVVGRVHRAEREVESQEREREGRVFVVRFERAHDEFVDEQVEGAVSRRGRGGDEGGVAGRVVVVDEQVACVDVGVIIVAEQVDAGDEVVRSVRHASIIP